MKVTVFIPLSLLPLSDVTFENVDFGDGKNVLSVYFSGDKYNTEEEIDVIIGDSIETGKRIRAEVIANTTELDCYFSQEIVVGEITGVQNVYIEAVDYKSVNAHRLSPYKDEDALFIIETLYGGLYDEYIPSRSLNDQNPVKYLSSDPRHPFVWSTWPGTVLKYEDVEITADFNAFVWAAATSEPWTNGTVTVYFDSLDSEPVGVFTIDSLTWSDFSQKISMLDKTVPKGTHDVYAVFGGTETCSDFYYFGFAYK